jgi:hypothetical protein
MEKLTGILSPKDGNIGPQSNDGVPPKPGPTGDTVAVGIGAGPYFTTGGPIVTGTPYIGTTLPGPSSKKPSVEALTEETSIDAEDVNAKATAVSRLKILTSKFSFTLSTHFIDRIYIITIK